MTDIGFMVRSANPVPDDSQQLTDDELVAVLLLAQQRSGNMDAKELTRPVEPDRKRTSSWWIAVAAFAAVIVVVGAVVLLIRPTSDVAPATPTPTTEAQSLPTTTIGPSEGTTDGEVDAGPVMTPELEAFVDEYVAVYNSGDVDAFAALFVPGAQRTASVSDGLAVSLDKLLLEMESLSRQESVYELTGCEAIRSGVTCDMQVSGPVERALIDGPILGSTTFLLNADGLITEVRGNLIVTPEVAEPQFLSWMESNHPEVFEQMTTPSFRELMAYEDSTIWLEYAPLWAEAGRP